MRIALFIAIWSCLLCATRPTPECASSLLARFYSTLPSTAIAVEEPAYREAVFKKVRLHLFPGFSLAGVPSPREVALSSADTRATLRQEVAARLAFLEGRLRNPNQYRVQVWGDRSSTPQRGFPEVLDSVEDYIGRSQAHLSPADKALIAAQRRILMLCRLGGVACFLGQVSGCLPPTPQLADVPKLALSYAALIGFNEVLLRAFAYLVSGKNRAEERAFGVCKLLDVHQALPTTSAAVPGWAHLGVNLQEQRTLDLISLWDPYAAPGLSSILVVTEPARLPN